jgi:hypothetical protein
MGSDFGNSEQNLCGANSVNNQLIFNGTNGNLNNNNRINTNRVRVSLEFDHNEAGSSGCVPSSEWYKYYRIARKNKKKKAAHIKFRLRCFDNLNEIRDSVNSMEYQPERSQAFVVTAPKVREIIAAAFRDRIIQTYLVQRILPAMEAYLHPDSYACRKGKGGLRAVQHLHEAIFEATNGYTRDAWIYKLDFRGFFMSVDTELWVPWLADWIDTHFSGADKELLKYVARVVFQSLPQCNCDIACHPIMFQLVPEHKKQLGKASFRGIPIGNVTSQAFVLITTTPFLRLVECIVYAFSHYTDDNCGVVTDKDDFLALRPVIADFADRQCHYTVHPDKFYFQHYSKGVEFLGYRLKYGLILPSKRLMHNFKWKVTTAIRKADGNRFYMLANKDRFMSVVNSCCGLLKHTASYNYRKRELSRLKDSAWVEVFDFDEARWLKVTIKKGYRKSDYYKHIAKRRKIEIFKPLKLQAA